MVDNEKTLPMIYPSYDTVIDVDEVLKKPLRLQDHFGIPFNIFNIEHRTGRRGSYVVMEVQNILSGEEYRLSTGAVLIVTTLKAIDEANKFPISAKFQQMPNSDLLEMKPITEEDLQ